MSILARIILMIGLSPLLVQAQSSGADDRLRDLLRQTTLQLREAQDENASLKAKQQVMAQQLAAGPQSAPPAKPAAAVDAAQTSRLRRALDEQTASLASAQQQLTESQQALAKWQAGYQQAADLARARDADAKKFEALYHDTDSRAQTCAAKNAQLFTLGSELLDRYQKKGVWDALGNDEPFTQVHRVQLEDLAQDYRIKLSDQKINPAATPPPEQ